MLGAFLAVLSAASFAFNTASTRRGVLNATVSQALAITVPIGVPMFFLAALASGSLPLLASFPAEAIAMMALVGPLHFVCGRYCNYRSVKAIGANLSGPVIQLSLVVSLALAVFVLGEALTPLRIVGIALVALGPALMRHAEKAKYQRAPDPDLPVFRPAYGEGYLFGLLSAAAYGVTPILIRVVVERQGLGGSLVAGLISYAAATIAIVFLLLWPAQLRHVLLMDRVSAKWFTWSGVFVCLSQIFLYMALAVAPVSVVMPILQLQLVLRYGLARLMNPHHEVFGGRMMLATAVSVLGALALSVSTEFVLALVPLPDWIVTVLRWHWP